jgi:hypothetical protein
MFASKFYLQIFFYLPYFNSLRRVCIRSLVGASYRHLIVCAVDNVCRFT